MESALRKAGVRLIPLAAAGYAIAYVDRTNLSFAALQMNREIGLSPSVYGLGAGLFFLSYAVCELPSNLLLVRFGARRWLSRVLILQGEGRFSSGQIGFLLGALHLSGAAAMLFNGRHSDRTGERYWHIVVPCAVMMAGFCAAGSASAPLAVIAGFAAVLLGFNAMQGTVWALPPEFLAGKSAAVGIAAINTFAIIGGFLGPYGMGLWKDAMGDYRHGLAALAVPTAIAAVIMLDMRRRAMGRLRAVPA